MTAPPRRYQIEGARSVEALMRLLHSAGLHTVVGDSPQGPGGYYALVEAVVHSESFEFYRSGSTPLSALRKAAIVWWRWSQGQAVTYDE